MIIIINKNVVDSMNEEYNENYRKFCDDLGELFVDKIAEEGEQTYDRDILGLVLIQRVKGIYIFLYSLKFTRKI